MPINKTFAYHKPSEEGMERTTVLREAYSILREVIDDQCPNSREKSLALTELETSAMWAIKAVVFNDPYSEAEAAE